MLPHVKYAGATIGRQKTKEAQYRIGDVVVNPFKSRGMALKEGKLVRSTADSHLIALDAQTGAPFVGKIGRRRREV
jgi:hypothetical protein